MTGLFLGFTTETDRRRSTLDGQECPSYVPACVRKAHDLAGGEGSDANQLMLTQIGKENGRRFSQISQLQNWRFVACMTGPTARGNPHKSSSLARSVSSLVEGLCFSRQRCANNRARTIVNDCLGGKLSAVSF